ncbi:Cytochrome c oxidase subunit 6 [Imshaugia aleurites]|uniref:Cytochrome c oxidase subunit 6, mitochondrial n=1 Tax=Imshaugia aleurites TaxID=172621 RepID=A0A8H3EZ17_9LECA|nr:Cytochrome c oxidase subunit 6 [Imshaugia aleurites]
MSSTTLFRLAARTQPSCLLRSSQPAKKISPGGVYAGSSATVACSYFSTTVKRAADKDGQEATGGSGHHEESFEEFTARYVNWAAPLSSTCNGAQSIRISRPEAAPMNMRKNLMVFKMFLNYRYEDYMSPRAARPENSDLFVAQQRNLNNAFAYDLVPSPSVITAALRAARRVNDFPTAVRVFEGIKAKVENKGQYDEYLRDLEPLREELGIDLKEDLYPEQLYTGGANRA